LGTGLPEYIETFKQRFKQMKEALSMAKSEHDVKYVKGQMNELYKLIEMHVQSLRNIQSSMKKFAASQDGVAVASSTGSRPELAKAERGQLESFLKTMQISETDLQTLRQKAWDQIIASDWDGALTTLTRTVELAPDDMRILVLLGWAYSGKEMYEKAEGIYDLVLEKEPDHPMALANLGYISLKRCNYREAIEFLSRALRQDSDKTAIIYANYYMGLVYFERQMYSDAVSFLQKSIQLAPNLMEAYYHLGLARKNMEEVDEAKRVWLEGLERNQQNRWSELVSQELTALEAPSPGHGASESNGFSP
jgi:tetratricopeptide (TPR) repeat protein